MEDQAGGRREENRDREESRNHEESRSRKEKGEHTKLRRGFTTGSCAAAAAKAALYMLLTGKEKKRITIITPAGIPFETEITDIVRKETEVSCAVIKDGGDDPDVTTGCHITATVSLLEEKAEKELTEENDAGDEGGREGKIPKTSFRILTDGGTGVGRVTKPGLDQPVGAAAINHVPREMIRKEAEDVLRTLGLMDASGNAAAPEDRISGIRIVISVPGGEKVAEKTFNPRLGIVGGISILGTSGIVEPMSEQAIRDTIRVELRQKKALGYPVAPVSPGNYGLEFMKRTYGYDLDRSVKCSNFIGDTIDMAADLGFEELLLTGHIGKLVKVSGGMLNTHSKMGDCRMELLSAAALLAGCSGDTARKILSCVNTEEGVRILKEQEGEDLCRSAMQILMERIMRTLERKADGRLKIGCILYSNEHGLLAKSALADGMLQKLLRMQAREDAGQGTQKA